ncbi:hypothetical protein N658DRAFT_493064 [Parathielavia hyrcaniae]|uniref:Uncharacterized protein n=1 Tax=Parathielavia hyrcaniae TaxID=113614 RepID=A0AAN6T5G6_9PEZI|nr:hypothetical protein N658DRAFT_493064 [Parathielavia hyrcaniae]
MLRQKLKTLASVDLTCPFHASAASWFPVYTQIFSNFRVTQGLYSVPGLRAGLVFPFSIANIGAVLLWLAVDKVVVESHASRILAEST